ncbi:MAG: HAD family hydrolase [Theionarchaea archaeon]|nr:HAD family hydrolase [Theionarchaea archaeon]MBU7020796.1 HAD family hydrolase [Theionarchaea archaeon]MBU7034808.1 HAD family hydrolase [Theionarchaea archaeon]MBU7040279.1 HAD family hydrolase [Theionarchaea archaeon]
MVRVISFDVDGTLVDSSFTEHVWLEGIPQLYANKHSIDMDSAKRIVLEEYEKVGEDDIRWYQLDYWFRRFDLSESPHNLLNKYKHHIAVYEDVIPVLESLSGDYILIVASNAHRDFLSLTLSEIKSYFDYIFSAVSDFNEVRKHENFYWKVCRTLNILPEEMAHVGDHYKFDYKVPSSLGVHAFYLRRLTHEKKNPEEIDLPLVTNLKDFENEVRHFSSDSITSTDRDI